MSSDNLEPLPSSAPEAGGAIPTRPNRISVAFAILAGLSFAASLFLPALLFERRDPLLGYTVLAWGWWGVLAGSLAWYANAILVFAVRFYFKGYPGCSLALALAALALAATSPWAKEWWFSEAAGTKITGLGIEYNVWLASIVLFALAAASSFIPSVGRSRQLR